MQYIFTIHDDLYEKLVMLAKQDGYKKSDVADFIDDVLQQYVDIHEEAPGDYHRTCGMCGRR
jgi:cell division septum initiation protein DivIVA